MFGHQDDNTNQVNNTEAAVASATTAPSDNQANDSSSPSFVTTSVAPTIDTTAPAPDEPSISSEADSQSAIPEPEIVRDVLSPAGGYPVDPSLKVLANTQVPELHLSAPLPTPTPAPSLAKPEPDENDLVVIKQHALDELLPLVDELDQTPEERFRTLMMMIQASDNQSLIKPAYETAHKIKDEKSKAQALLDIVNEINYFTQNTADSETKTK